MNQYDLEQEIYKCWSIVEDIETIYHNERLYTDTNEMQNALLGLMTLYNLKFEKLFDVFCKSNGFRQDYLEPEDQHRGADGHE